MCTCKATTDAEKAPVKPVISNAAALTICLALKNLDSRLAPLEAKYGLSGADGGSDLDQRFAEAEEKRIALLKEAHVNKIEKMVEMRKHASKNEAIAMAEAAADPKDQQPDDDDRNIPFDPSSGDNAQATPKHPLGFQSRKSSDAAAKVKVPTKAEYERMKFEHDARENRAFRDKSGR